MWGNATAATFAHSNAQSLSRSCRARAHALQVLLHEGSAACGFLMPLPSKFGEPSRWQCPSLGSFGHKAEYVFKLRDGDATQDNDAHRNPCARRHACLLNTMKAHIRTVEQASSHHRQHTTHSTCRATSPTPRETCAPLARHCMRSTVACSHLATAFPACPHRRTSGLRSAPRASASISDGSGGGTLSRISWCAHSTAAASHHDARHCPGAAASAALRMTAAAPPGSVPQPLLAARRQRRRERPLLQRMVGAVASTGS